MGLTSTQPDAKDVDPFCAVCPATIAERVGKVIRARKQAGDTVVALGKAFRLSQKEVHAILDHPHRSAA